MLQCLILHGTYFLIESISSKPNPNGWPLQWSKLHSLPESIITRDINKANTNTEKNLKLF